MPTKTLHRAGTMIQLVSLFACIATLVLVSAPRASHVARAETVHRRDPIPVVSDSPVLASTLIPNPVIEQRVVVPIPACAWTPEAKTSLTAMVRIESSSGKDTAAIAWTMARRWLAIGRYRGRAFADYVVDTSRPLRLHRSGDVEQLTSYQSCVLGIEVLDERGRDRCRIHTETSNDAIGDTLDAWARGEVPDPCDGRSFQWAAPWFRHRSTPVECGDRANRFYELPAISHDHYAARVSVEPTSCAPPREPPSP